MEAKAGLSGDKENVIIGERLRPDVISERGSKSSLQQNANASVKVDSQPVELPAYPAAQQVSQDVIISGPGTGMHQTEDLPTLWPQIDVHRAEEITICGPQLEVLHADKIATCDPQTEKPHAEEDAPPRTSNPIFLTRNELLNVSGYTVMSAQHSESTVTTPCTATITNLSELPVQPPDDEKFGLGEKITAGDHDGATVDGITQAQLLMAATAPTHTQLPGVITQIAPAMLPDNDSTDEAYAESTTTSFLTSIKSEVSRGVLENERLYPSYGRHDYGMPIDEDELDRMDLQHRKYEMVIGDRHFLAPIGPTPQRILDLGTGTGIWALDVADLYPSAQVTGVDIAPIQPKWTASNCQFEIDDVEETWTFKDNSFDFIHFRDPLYVVRNWPRLMEQCYLHTRPGGWCELACIYPVPMCDDGTMPEDSGFKVICDKFIEASYLFGTPADSPLQFSTYLRDAGFVDVAEHIFKIPSSPWPKDRRLKQIGALEMTNVVAGATAFGLRAFEKVFGWTKDQTEMAMVNFRRDVKNRHYHQYCQYFVVYGRKPIIRP